MTIAKENTSIYCSVKARPQKLFKQDRSVIGKAYDDQDLKYFLGMDRH